MVIHRKSILRILPVILFLLASQLQAKNVFMCPMMDKNTYGTTMAMHNEEPCYHNLNCNSVLDPDSNSCDSKILILHTGQDAQLNIPIPDLVFESDIDPPQEKFTKLNFVFQLHAAIPLRGFPRANHVQIGSKIHLITQRLRI